MSDTIDIEVKTTGNVDDAKNNIDEVEKTQIISTDEKYLDEKIFKSVVEFLDEDQLNSVIAVNGSSPAHVKWCKQIV